MEGNMPAVFLLSFLVNLLLLTAADRLCGGSVKVGRMAAAAVLRTVHTACCLLPGFYFLGNALWRVVCMVLTAGIAYGICRDGVRRASVFVVLSLALEGAASGMGKDAFLIAVAVGSVIFLLRGRSIGIWGTTCVPVELCYGATKLRITALRDTGNTLRDPITGQEVLVVGAEVAGALTGLTSEQLKAPIESMGALPGLRLIPYHTVGNRGFMLALQLPNVKIGTWKGSAVVAFAPEGLGNDGSYQALTGGMG